MQETRALILDRLAAGPVSGPTLAADLDISRAAVWNHVETLRDDGFEIRDTDDGYTLAGVPEFGGAATAFELDSEFAVEFHDELASTNATARERANEGAEDVVVVAETQTGGRGRLDREWSSPDGGIYASLVVRPDVPSAHAPVYTLAAAVAVADAARETGVEADIKWPNDVQVDGKKLAGILTEMEGEADRVSWLVVGVGANANVDAADLPCGTSIETETGPITRRAFLASIVDRFADLTDDVGSIVPAWRERASTLGQQVRVETPRETIEGEAIDIEFPGTLLVETDDGVRRVTAGDCEHLRPRE
ncbi:biotin--[acetyl-CoA-carboxylase] ligase [Halosegnis rubeus]|jgi:BirA family biotin operon repressor/biotin-[acetyl-CoA-carboxylase] ligase|uniref:Biotin--[acetyl-CoA-carboxylase] ligase n=1 Tax=Halosegnis rubeus TaxID=2212850 RepID=A0A5N5UEX9_9EURY|nr:biotin--[acetyl-CoA-carboxylase] ligase [Halosegnis rubeus]KAB7513260.1 biotin--[acetyl-CoA-carboxylase] ligase [Halosegnis rubeus]KAB7517243.1 biotin--[acetyl-CoA-carboxylase] ligase [Halosegnis rubeus]